MAQAIVNSFTQLRTAALDPTIDYIYVTEDITLESGGILLRKDKPSLVIDCRFPDDDETGVIHSITDINNNTHSDTIRIESGTAAFHLTLKNCTFYGRNFYGAISCINSSTQRNTILTLENVDYSGPQSSYNRYGTTEIINGNYDIGRYNGTSSSVDETFETNILILDGNVNIKHDGAVSGMYLSESNPQLIVRDNAVVNIEIVQRALMFLDGSPININLGANSKFLVKAEDAMFNSAAMQASSFFVGAGAEFVFDQQSSAAGISTVRIGGDLTVSSDARFIVIRKAFSASEPLLRFSTTATASFNDPLSVVLYNPGGRVINWSSGTGTLIIDSQIVNYWVAATGFPAAGTFDDVPLYNWTKADKSNVSIQATITSTATSNVTTNMIVDEDAPVIPTNTTFRMQDARVLALGKLWVKANPLPKQTDLTVSGSTIPTSNVRVKINDGAAFDGSAAEGGFSVAVSPRIEKKDEVLVGANYDFKTVYEKYIALGTIELLVPERLKFQRFTSPTRKLFYLRVDPNWTITVRDSRDNGTDWQLYAHAEQPLIYQAFQLPNALVYKQGASIQYIEAGNVMIHEGTANTDPDYTDTLINWPAAEGLLLHEPLGTHCNKGHYETNVDFWIVEKPTP